MNKYLNKVMIIDGSYVLHRSLNTPALQELQTSTGIKSGGVFGALRILQSEIKKFPGYFPIFCFDKGLSKRRLEIYPDYKANRKRKEADALIAAGLDQERDDYLEEYHKQRDDLIEILKSLGIPSLLIPGWEGDDLQYLLSKVCNEGVIISDDKDLIQLVSPNIKIRRSMRDELIEWSTSDEYYHHPRFTIRKAIVGDGSDNIPKCAPGVGDKGADQIAQLIESYSNLAWTVDETFEHYRNALDDYLEKNEKGAIVKKIKALRENWNQFEVNYQLIDLRLVESPIGFESMIRDLIVSVVGHSNVMKAYQLIGKYEMNSIYPDQIVAMIAPASSQVLL